MAAGCDSRAAMRARIVQSLLLGEAPARIVERLGVSYATVRAARRRYALAGAVALETRRSRPRASERIGATAGAEAQDIAAKRIFRFRAPVADVLLALQDNYAEPLDRALVARYGAAEAARRHFLAAWGSRTVTQKTERPFEWYGHDLSATLDSFVDWCAAIHAGEEAPAPPTLALF